MPLKLSPPVFQAPTAPTLSLQRAALVKRLGPAAADEAVATMRARWAQTFAGHAFWLDLSESERDALATATALRAQGINPPDVRADASARSP